MLSADGLHIPVSEPDELMDEARVLRVASAIAAGYRVGPADAELRGRRFDVMGAAGRVCTAVVESSWIVGLEPLESWDPDEPPAVGSVVEDMHYANQNGAVYRTLRLEPEGDCDGAVWARDASLPAIPHAGTTEREVGSAELDAYRALPVYSMMQETLGFYDAEREDEWIADGDGGRGFGPTAWDVTVDREARVVVSTWAGAICWGFEGTLMTVFRSDGGVESISWGIHAALRPVVALDVDGDGRLELIEHDGFETRFYSPTLTTPTIFRAAEATTGC